MSGNHNDIEKRLWGAADELRFGACEYQSTFD
jgi:hypothetical protein